MVSVVQPPAPVLTAAEARRELQFGPEVETATIEALIAAATAAIDGPAGWLGRAIGAQTLRLTLDGFYGCGRAEIALPYPPLLEVLSVKYDDTAGAEQTIASSVYGLLAGRGIYPRGGQAWPSTGPGPGAVRIDYRAGYTAVPAPIRQAILLGVRELHTAGAQDPSLRSETVDGVGSQTWTVSPDTLALVRNASERLLAPYRVFGL